MQDKISSRPKGEPGQAAPFATIDDLAQKAEALSDGLKKLSGYKYPLDVRKGVRKGVRGMSDDGKSSQLKGAGRTYFFDVETTREGKDYLKITESRKDGKGDWKRSTVNVFPEDARAFADRVSEATRDLR